MLHVVANKVQQALATEPLIWHIPFGTSPHLKVQEDFVQQELAALFGRLVQSLFYGSISVAGLGRLRIFPFQTIDGLPVEEQRQVNLTPLIWCDKNQTSCEEDNI